MRFRPCIDIHNGKVKQIVGGTLCDREDSAAENFVSGENAAAYARMYAADGLTGGHVILLNAADSPFYEATRAQALDALRAAPGTLQVGGGITPENAPAFLDAGASHVIVTSYVFRKGRIDYRALERMVRAVGRERLVLDLSARRKAEGAAGSEKKSLRTAGEEAWAFQKESDAAVFPDRGRRAGGPETAGAGSETAKTGPRKQGSGFYVVTDRWQVFTREEVTVNLLESLGSSCSEFLIHGVDVEGKQSGPDRDLLEILGSYTEGESLPMTYAGGIRSIEDIETIRRAGRGRVDFTVGSALDLFGGTLAYRELVRGRM